MAQDNFFDRFDEPTPRQREESRQRAAAAASSEAGAARTRGLTPAEIRKAEADALKAELDLAEAQAKSEERQKKLAEANALKSEATAEIARVIAAAAAAKRLSQTGFMATGFGSGAVRSVSEATPAGEVAGLIDTVAANTAFDRLQRMRDLSPTGGALGNVTELELNLLKSSIANLDPTKSDAAFQRSMDVVMDNYMRVFRRLGGDPAYVQEAYQMRTGEPLPEGAVPALKPREEKAAAAPEPTTEMRVGGETYVTEESKRAAARIQEEFDRGADITRLNELSQEILGAPIPDQEQLKAAIEYRDRGGKGAQIVPGESQRPLAQQIIGSVAESPVGAYAIGAGSALTAGGLDELAGLMRGPEAAERARFARQYSQTTNPLSSALGEVTGGIMASIPAVRGAQALLPGMTATRAALVGEGLLGATTGALEASPGSRLQGAALGGTLGIAGGAVPGAAARVMSPRTPESVRLMREAGVKDMSLGQVLGMPEAEAGIAGIMPGGGDIALRAQKQSFDQFQDAYVNDALKNIGVEVPSGLKPTKRMETAQKAFDRAYEAARAQMRIVPDADMRNAIAEFRQRLSSDEFSEQAAARLDKLLKDQVQRRIPGAIGGDEYKSLSSLLGKRRAAFAKRGDAEMADGVAELQRIVDDAARRHSPPEAVDLLDRADRGYAILTRAEEAARTLGNAPGEFTPQQALSAVRKGDITARNRAYVRGEARGQKLAEAATEALGKAPPTEVSRIERGLGFTGNVLASPLTLPINIGMGLSNLPVVRPALNTMIAGQRPAAVTRVADIIRERPEYLAAIAGGTALQGARDRPEDIEDLRQRYGIGAPRAYEYDIDTLPGTLDIGG